MAILAVKVAEKKQEKTFAVEVSAAKFERLAAAFGFFGKDFLASIARAEKDIYQGKVKKIRSFADLLKR